MAVVGDQLLQPESGWRRYDVNETTVNLKDFTLYNDSAYNGAVARSDTPGHELTFAFTGTSLRILGYMWNTIAGYSISIIIDGKEEFFNENIGSLKKTALVYEKIGLDSTQHNAVIRVNNNRTVYIDALDVDEHGEVFIPPAQVGDQLTEPEVGWKRYDDTHPAIKYEGSWTNSSGVHYTKTIGDCFSFKFKGTSLRLVNSSGTGTGIVEVNIDNIKENVNLASENSINSRLTYEKLGLEDAIHTVTVTLIQKTIIIESWLVNIDAIDIDSTGRLLHPQEKLTPGELTVGDRIRARYTAPTSGQVGTFSNLGGETYKDGINDFIPPESSATSDGDFYWLCVEDNVNDKAILIADRNLQHSISWDCINEEGMTNTGREITF